MKQLDRVAYATELVRALETHADVLWQAPANDDYSVTDKIYDALRIMSEPALPLSELDNQLKRLIALIPSDLNAPALQQLSNQINEHHAPPSDLATAMATFNEAAGMASLAFRMFEAMDHKSATETNAGSDSAEASGDEDGLRFLNAGFYASDNTPLAVDRPLLVNESYQFVVDIGPFWGPGNPDTPFPDAAVQQLYDPYDRLELTVVVNARDIQFSATSATLSLPVYGKTDVARFAITVLPAGRHTLDVDVLVAGHLLQSRRTMVTVVSAIETTLHEPPQFGWITWTRSAQLSPDDIGPLLDAPRSLTILMQEDGPDITLRFYRYADGVFGHTTSYIGAQGLSELVAQIRAFLTDMVTTLTPPASETEMTRQLGQLAELGYTLYVDLFGEVAEQFDDSTGLDLALLVGDVVQIAPLSDRLSVPWEVMYDRPVEAYDPTRTKLIPNYAQWDAAEVDDATIVDPRHFWGYRYVIEQLPCRIAPEESPPARGLPLRVRNEQPLRLDAVLHVDFPQLDTHLDALQALAPAGLTIAELTDKEAVKQRLTTADTPVDLLYFYTHGGSERRRPFLTIGRDQKLTRNDLTAWRVDFRDNPPLVFLNACESSAYGPDSFGHLLTSFAKRGAAGMIGTQCTVVESLADVMMRRFMTAFMRQITAGQALYEARLALFFDDNPDPRGLVYSLYASADVQLAQPVQTTPPSLEQ